MDVKVGQLVVFNKSADAAPFRVERILADGFTILVVDARNLTCAWQRQDKSSCLPYQGPASWAPEVIADASQKWCGNSARFATEEEALGSAQDLMARWMLVQQVRAVQSVDPVTHRWIDGRLEFIPEAEPDEAPELGPEFFANATLTAPGESLINEDKEAS